ncbi:MAG: tRNA epoxyqueuosine(34) reductase QueG [Dehalococcoidia bacterium]|nr:tRNA epoxyqueuosine(34) reductase QueG [Dehalococcoidia bacterium]
MSLEEQVKGWTRELGFDLVGVTSADRFDDHESVTLERIGSGLMDGLPWYTPSRVRRGSRPEELLPGARSIITVGLSYHVDQLQGVPSTPAGKVARYAWGDDYHKVMKKKLKLLAAKLSEELADGARSRWYVDDGPMLDRAAASRAGIGWFGKSTNLLTRTHGSWVFLGQLVTDVELAPDEPLKKTCGSCVRCIDICPTGAIVAPYVLDNRRCISYLTIENRGEIPREMRPLMGDWVFGCDLCQDVCPVNFKAAPSREEAFRAVRFDVLDLAGMLELTDEEFRERFRSSPIKRATKAGLQRNVCVALGNAGDPGSVAPLAKALKQGDALVRGHAAWALGQIGGEKAILALEEAACIEVDAHVRDEIAASLDAAREESPLP